MEGPSSLLVRLPHHYCQKCTDALHRWWEPIPTYSAGLNFHLDHDDTIDEQRLLQEPAGLPVWIWRISDLKSSARHCRGCRFLAQTLDASPWVSYEEQDYIQLKAHLVGSQHATAYREEEEAVDIDEEDDEDEDNGEHVYPRKRKRGLDPLSKYQRHYRPALRVFRRMQQDGPRHRGTSITTRDPKYVASELIAILPLITAPKSGSVGVRPPLIFDGRIVGVYADFALIKRWFSMCRTEHIPKENDAKGTRRVSYGNEVHCGPSINKTIPHFRLVDVQQRCVVSTSPEQEYAALSYVWGTAKRLLLCKSNVERLSTPGALADCDEIPRTFTDSFIVTEKLGIRYIWIDALCVVQDNEEQLVQHMSVMDAIYSSAVLTIVSDSPSADSGIHGVSVPRGPTQATLKHGGITYVNAKRNLENALKSSCWESRAWCLQEKVFSKRLLIFTEYQAFYQCLRSTLLEDTVIEMSGKSHGCIFRNDAHYPRLKHRPPPSPRNFWVLLPAYTQRQLSFESDAIRAFSGILKGVEREDGPAIWGIPKHHFEHGLVCSLSMHKMSLRRPAFPSWSWAGWRGNSGPRICFHETNSYGIWKLGWHYHRLSEDTGLYELTPLVHPSTLQGSQSGSRTVSEDLASDCPSASSSDEAEPSNPFTRLCLLKPTAAEMHEDALPSTSTVAGNPLGIFDHAVLESQAPLVPAFPNVQAVTTTVTAHANVNDDQTPQLLDLALSPIIRDSASPTLFPSYPPPLAPYPSFSPTSFDADAAGDTTNAQQNQRDQECRGVDEQYLDYYTWRLPNHPGEPTYTTSLPLPPLHTAPSTIHPISHIIRTYTSVARVLLIAVPAPAPSFSGKYHFISSDYAYPPAVSFTASHEDDVSSTEYYSLLAPHTRETIANIELDSSWAAPREGKLHELAYISLAEQWPDGEEELDDAPEALYLLLLEGEGEVKTKVALVGPVDVQTWRKAEPEWRCVNIA